MSSNELSLFLRDRREAEFRSKELYFEGKKQREICEIVGIDPTTLKNLIYGQKGDGGWKAEREKLEAKALRQIASNQRQRFLSLIDGALVALERSISDLNVQKKDPVTGEDEPLRILSVGEMEKLTRVASSMQLMLSNSLDEADERLKPGQAKVRVTVETLIDSLKQVDPIGFGADDWGDEDDDSIEVDYDVIR